MTYRSLSIESHASCESAHAPYVLGVNLPAIISLNAYTFPKRATQFAKEKGLDIFYVDNAWLRIAIDGLLLKEFLAHGSLTEPSYAEYIAKIGDDCWYVIREEEF